MIPRVPTSSSRSRTTRFCASCPSRTKRSTSAGSPTDRKSTRLNSKSQSNLVCRLLLEKKKKKGSPLFTNYNIHTHKGQPPSRPTVLASTTSVVHTHLYCAHITETRTSHRQKTSVSL